MALAVRGVRPLPGEGPNGLHGLGRPFDAIGSVSAPFDGGSHVVISSKFTRVPLNQPAGNLDVIEYDEADLERVEPDYGHPGALRVWVSDFAVVDEIVIDEDNRTFDPAPYVVPGF